MKRTLLALAALAVTSTPALAAPPSNDQRADARAVGVPSTVNGTTREATTQGNDPRTTCDGVENSVWYSFDASADQRVSVEMSARGDLEAEIAVYRRDRSALEELDCDATDRRGDAGVRFAAVRGEAYLIRVGEGFGSESGDFTLELFVAEPESRPPGPRLPRRGGAATVDRTRDFTDPWSKRLVEGLSYVVTLASRSAACPSVGVYDAGIGSFDTASPLEAVRCNGHRLFTPDRSGRYSFLVRAGRGARGAQRYRLKVRPATRDDTAPGRTIDNYQRVRGHVGPRAADVVDLLRFHVHRRSNVALRLSAPGDVDLELRRVRGRLVARSFGGGVRTNLGRGRYYAVVRAGETGGKYTLRPAIRDITRTRTTFNGRHESIIGLGQLARIDVAISPAATGRVVIVVERLDPLEGYQFFKRFRRRTTSGFATASFAPRRPGRFRARAVYRGSRLSAGSESGFAYLSAREEF